MITKARKTIAPEALTGFQRAAVQLTTEKQDNEDNVLGGRFWGRKRSAQSASVQVASVDSIDSAAVADVTPKVNLNMEHADAEMMIGTGWREFQKVRRHSQGTRHVTALPAHVSAFVHCALFWLKECVCVCVCTCTPAHPATSCCVCILALPPSPRPHLTLQMRDLANDDLQMMKNAARDEAQYYLGVGEQEFHKARGLFFSDAHQAKAYFVKEQEHLRKEMVTFCGVTFVAHGSVVLSKGGDSWVGTTESPLLRDDAVSRVPKFLLTSPPLQLLCSSPYFRQLAAWSWRCY